MSAAELIDRSPGWELPAPPEFILAMKTVGFALHAVPMNLWYAGIAVALLLAWRGNEHARRFSARLMRQMPVIIALGINFGIVPLLFVQVGFAPVFYPATVLMAWPWLLIIVLLLPAYYGVYIYRYSLDAHGDRLPWFGRASGWTAALLLVTIGFLFANGMSLVQNVAGWEKLYLAHNYYGAALGTALNTGDPRLWPRWLMMFGLALTTTAAWVVVDGGWFARGESAPYHAWVRRFAWKLYLLGMCWFAATGSWYVFGTWPQETKDAMFNLPWRPLTVATAVAPGLVWLSLLRVAGGSGPIEKGMATRVGCLQFGVVLLNAVSRQVVQQLEIAPFFNIMKQPVNAQWGSLAVFAAALLTGVVAIAWMVFQVCASAGNREPGLNPTGSTSPRPPFSPRRSAHGLPWR